jgi:hypothetical protein
VDEVILNCQGPLCEGDQEVVKSSGRNETMWVTIHKYMEVMLGISLYSYLYPKLTKNVMHLLLLLMFFSSTKSAKEVEKKVEQVLYGSRGLRR